MHDISVFDEVFLALQTVFSFFPRCCYRSGLNQVVVSDHLGTDKAALKVGVDNACSLGSLRSLTDGPRTHLLHASRKVSDQAKQFIRSPDEAVETGFLQSQLFQKHLLVLALQLGDLGFDLGADDDYLCAFFRSVLADSLYMRIVVGIVNPVLGHVANVKYLSLIVSR